MMRKIIASLAVSIAMLGGVTACSGDYTGDSGYVDEVQYGYYDAGYHDASHYHYYAHPKQVRVTRKQYTSHQYEYSPHGTQHKVTVKHTTTTVHHSNGTKTITHKRTTTHTTTRRR
jgi:hypothetical protein